MTAYNLLSVNTSLSKEWDYNKNELTHSEVMPNSRKKVWWKCQHCII